MATSDMKISVIVPAFNAEGSIGQCLGSIQRQKHGNLEIVVVDDDSSDRTSETIDDLAAGDPRIKALRPEVNVGVHGARRLGVAAASGDLIGFVDADDYLEPHMYSTLLDRMERTQASIAICSASLVSQGRAIGPRIRIKSAGVISGERVLGDYCGHRLGSGVLWNKLYRREVIEAPALQKLERAVDASEDYIVNFGAFARASSAVLCPEPMYNYVVHDSNASGRSGWPVFARLFRAYVVCLESYAAQDQSFPPLIDRLYLKQLHQPAYRLDEVRPGPDVVAHLAESLHRMAEAHPTSIHSILHSLPLWHSRFERAIGRVPPN